MKLQAGLVLNLTDCYLGCGGTSLNSWDFGHPLPQGNIMARIFVLPVS